MAWLVDMASWLCLITGGAFAIIGGIGIVRFPDLFTRLHAASVTDTMGAGLILFGLILQSGFHLGTFKLFLLLVFLLFIGPTSTHALAEAAVRDPDRDDITPLPENEESAPSNT
jgi:multicomponent Na+:H+ antiporter subunit G